MTRINLRVAARDLRVGDDLLAYPCGIAQTVAQMFVQGPVNRVDVSGGVAYVWIAGHSPALGHAADVILNHGDPCTITREREVEDGARFDVIGPDDASLVDVYDKAEALALPGVARDEALQLIDALIEAFDIHLKGV